MATATMTMSAAHTGTTKTLPGLPFPLGAAYDGTGTNFSIFSEAAERIDLCLYEEDGRETRINITERDGYNWHVYLTGVGPGQLYGFRVYGPWDPKKGIRCCPSKLVLDPNCKAVSGSIQWSDALFAYRRDKADAAACSSSDDARLMMKSVVTNPYFNWNNEYRTHMPLEDTVIYELRVKGFMKRHPAVPPELRGTYAGVSHPAAIEYLKSLGITAHDGFTLHDLVTYEHKHNEANLENNKDGTDDNRSSNYGVEDETDDPASNDVRSRQARNFLTTLLLSQGVPMILGGDEIGRFRQDGSGMLGERLSQLVDFESLKLAAGALLLSPYVPLLFMGQEYGKDAPFQYFISYSDETLVAAVRKGRRDEFRAFARVKDFPDPYSSDTFENSKVRWDERTRGRHRILLAFYRRLIRLRNSMPHVVSKMNMTVQSLPRESLLVWHRRQAQGQVQGILNFSDEAQPLPLRVSSGRWTKVLDSADDQWAGPGAIAPAQIDGPQQITVARKSIVVFAHASLEPAQARAAAQASVEIVEETSDADSGGDL